MAQRRMFSKEITNSSEFQMMSPSAQALYFHIGMNADDDGFCEAFTIVRMTESKPDDLRALQERAFIYLMDSKVCIVKDWHTNNDIRTDRYSQSKYLSDPKYVELYGIIMQDKIKHLSRYRGMLPGITDGSTTGITQYRLGKVRKDLSADAEANNKEPMNTYNENKHTGDDLPDLDLDSGEIIEQPASKKKDLKRARPEEEMVFDLFRGNPARQMWGMRPVERAAAKILYDTFGMDELERRMQVIEKSKDEPWCPQIDTPSELLEKMPKMERYLKTV